MAPRDTARSAPVRSLAQYDLPHRPAANACSAGHQLSLACQAAAPIMSHASQDLTQCPIAPRRVRLIDYLHLAAAVAGDPQEPRRKGTEGFVQGLRAGR